MTTSDKTLWPIEPHTRAKHEILQRYLGAWFGILGQRIPHILYIDGFCGPGRYSHGEDGSPLIALKVALGLQSRLASTKISFLFIDERPDRIAHLQSELEDLNIPSNYEVYTIVSSFYNTLSHILDDVEHKGARLVPTFAFIDPFGFKGASFNLVQRLLKNPRTEVFVNVMMDSINRFLEHPNAGVRQHIIDSFGTSRVLEVVQETDRIIALRRLYFEQLKQHADYVRYFEMCNECDKTIYYLFFAGNHRLGHSKMKEAFWKVDDQSGYKFSDRTNPQQPILFSLNPAEELASLLQAQYDGQTQKAGNIIHFVEDKTAFTASHARGALRLLERNSKITIDPIKGDGSKRRKGTFSAKVTVHF